MRFLSHISFKSSFVFVEKSDCRKSCLFKRSTVIRGVKVTLAMLLIANLPK